MCNKGKNETYDYITLYYNPTNHHLQTIHLCLIFFNTFLFSAKFLSPQNKYNNFLIDHKNIKLHFILKEKNEIKF